MYSDLGHGQPSEIRLSYEYSYLGLLVMSLSISDPPNGGNDNHTDQNDAVVVHGRYRRRKRVWETIHDVEQGDEEHRGKVHHKPVLAHPEGSMRHVLATCKEIWCEAQGVRRRGQDDE